MSGSLKAGEENYIREGGIDGGEQRVSTGTRKEGDMKYMRISEKECADGDETAEEANKRLCRREDGRGKIRGKVCQTDLA